MEVFRADSRRSQPGPSEWFTGQVWLQEIVEAPTRLRAYRVTFSPGARTAWHSHPFGQALEVMCGRARIGRSDGEVEVLSAGDVVWSSPPSGTGTAPLRMVRWFTSRCRRLMTRA